METTRLVVGAAMRAPPTPQFRRRRLPHPRGGVHCLPFARAARPALLTRCSYSRKGNSNSRGKTPRESSGTVRLDVEESSDQGTKLANDQRKGDIRELFIQAQQNILYLNKQRLLVMEELKKLQDENEMLLQEIEVLEMEVQGVPLEALQSSRFCELLLRIDTMVISGMINMQEASDLREKVVNNRNIIQSTFSDIHHKANTELLSELRLFLRKPIEYATLYLCPNCYSYCLSFKDSTIQLHVLVPFSIHFNDPGHARQHSNSYILAIHILSSVITKWYIYLLSQVTCLT